MNDHQNAVEVEPTFIFSTVSFLSLFSIVLCSSLLLKYYVWWWSWL